jgi:signal transduction histidine kinase/ActR/RegA family two-component response regulator
VSAPEVAVQCVAPTLHWGDVGESEHFVQFYQDEAFLLQSVSGFIGRGIRSGSAAIVFATTPHLDQLERHWQKMGVGLESARACGQYIAHGAEETLSQLLLGEWPQARRFRDVIEPIVAAAAARFPRMVAFGEMVSLLWDKGRHDAALHLEELWNDLAKRYSFSLYCAYPIRADAPVPIERLRGVCAAHSRAIPAERYAALENPEERLAEICALQHKAAMLERQTRERERLEQELQQQLEKHADAERLRDEFLAILAHELRNPLAPIRSAAELMHLEQTDHAALSTARVLIERQVEQLAHLIDDLMDVSRVTQGTIELRKAYVDVQQIVRAAIEVTRPAVAGKEHHLEVCLPQQQVFVNGDAGRLAQVVANLLNNSAKYAKPNGCIRVSVAREGSEATIRVSDTGIGMTTEIVPRIFDMFTQGHGSASSVRDGLGAGLTLAKHLVELHGGNVEAYSEGLNKGSTFTVRLPLVEADIDALSSCTGTTREMAAPRRVGYRVLIADDNRDGATSLALLLAFEDCEVRTAHDGIEALQIAEEFRPEVVLLDIGMPGLDGYETARRLRERPWARHIALYAVTGWGEAKDKRLAQQAGFDRHLTKPVELETLRLLITTADRTA